MKTLDTTKSEKDSNHDAKAAGLFHCLLKKDNRVSFRTTETADNPRSGFEVRFVQKLGALPCPGPPRAEGPKEVPRLPEGGNSCLILTIQAIVDNCRVTEDYRWLTSRSEIFNVMPVCRVHFFGVRICSLALEAKDRDKICLFN